MGPIIPGCDPATFSRRLLGELARIPDAGWIVLAWAIAALPNLTVRSFIWEEGTNAELARNILAGGSLLEPAIYGTPWIEKPSLLPWLIAGTAQITGRVDEWSARLPGMLAVLATALMVHGLARRHAGRRAALLAAASFLFCPLLLRKLTIAEPDTVLTVLSFAAFLIWWHGIEGRRFAPWRWIACGTLLAILAMAKGPQPVAFFALGAGGFTVLQRRWPTLPGLLFCLSLPALATLAWGAAVYRPGALSGWLAYMRLDESVDPLTYLGERAKFAAGLLLDLIPATLLLPAVADLWRRRSFGHAPPVVAALVAYASLGTLALLLWPGAQTRYAMPIAPAVAVLAGITIDRLWRSRPWLARAVLGGTAALAAYQATLVLVAMPLLAERFGATRLAGQALGRAVAAAQAPAVATDIHTNELFYLSLPVRWINAAARGELPVPATLLATRNDLAEIAAARPDLSFQVLVETTAGPGLLAARVDHAGR